MDAHRSHPFAVKFYPLTDGEIHSFVEDVIDQQKAINRLMVQIDHIMATSAKGVLLFPLDQKPADIDWRDISERWAQPDGVIPVTGFISLSAALSLRSSMNDEKESKRSASATVAFLSWLSYSSEPLAPVSPLPNRASLTPDTSSKSFICSCRSW